MSSPFLDSMLGRSLEGSRNPWVPALTWESREKLLAPGVSWSIHSSCNYLKSELAMADPCLCLSLSLLSFSESSGSLCNSVLHINKINLQIVYSMTEWPGSSPGSSFDSSFPRMSALGGNWQRFENLNNCHLCEK